MKKAIWAIALAGAAASCSQSQMDRDVVCERYVHKYGVELEAKDWANRGRDGQVLTKRSDGVQITKSFQQGQLEGETVYTFPHRETIQKIETYSQGRLIGSVENNTSGQQVLETEYLTDSQKTERRWYDDGGMKSVETFAGETLVNGSYYNPKGQVEARIDDGFGTRPSRDSFGQLIGKETFHEGNLTSKSVFYPNGSPKEVIPVRFGKVEGDKRLFLPSGEPVEIQKWVDGVQHGPTILFENGEKIAEVPYVQGQRHGIERRFKSGTEVVEEINWRKDQKHGSAKTYVDGHVRTDWYYKNRPVTEASYQKMDVRN